MRSFTIFLKRRLAHLSISHASQISERAAIDQLTNHITGKDHHMHECGFTANLPLRVSLLPITWSRKGRRETLGTRLNHIIE